MAPSRWGLGRRFFLSKSYEQENQRRRGWPALRPRNHYRSSDRRRGCSLFPTGGRLRPNPGQGRRYCSPLRGERLLRSRVSGPIPRAFRIARDVVAREMPSFFAMTATFGADDAVRGIGKRNVVPGCKRQGRQGNTVSQRNISSRRKPLEPGIPEIFCR